MEHTHQSLSYDPIFGFLDSDEVDIFGNLFDDDSAGIAQDPLPEDPLADFDFWAAGGNPVTSSAIFTHQTPDVALLGNDIDVDPNNQTPIPQWSSPQFFDPRLAISQSRATVQSSDIVTVSLPTIDKTSTQLDLPRVSHQIPPNHGPVLPEFLTPDFQTTGAPQWTDPSVSFLQTAHNVPGRPIDPNPDSAQSTLPLFDPLPSSLLPYVYGPHAPGDMYPTTSSDNPISATFEIGNHLLDQSAAPPDDELSQQDLVPLFNLEGQTEFSDVLSNYITPADIQLNNRPFSMDLPPAHTGVSSLDSSAAPTIVFASQAVPPGFDFELLTPEFMLVEIHQEPSEILVDDLDISMAEEFQPIPSETFSPRTAALLHETDELMAEIFPSMFPLDSNGKEAQIISLDSAAVDTISTLSTRSVPSLV
jgi:hypothetical protein